MIRNKREPIISIAGADRKFYWADAKLEENTVLVSSPQLPNPESVRYSWEINPDGNLYNKEGLPAVPFRTEVRGQLFSFQYHDKTIIQANGLLWFLVFRVNTSQDIPLIALGKARVVSECNGANRVG